jgi:hypothetical protein
MPDRAELDWVARLRAAGYHITPATRDDLPPPEHTLPPRRTAAGATPNPEVHLEH